MQTATAKFVFPQKSITALAAVLFFCANSGLGIELGFSIQPSPLFGALYAIAIGCVLAIWVHRDSRSGQGSYGLDQSMYIFFLWPITFPLYVFRAYGLRRGARIVSTFIGIYLLTFLWMFGLGFFLLIVRAIFGGA
jgi:hypothetical protein